MHERVMDPGEYEKLGIFYLGERLEEGEHGLVPTGTPYLYRSKDLTTHAVCVGMTGSGKTGLGIALLEEAALDGVPAIILDPKGEMANLFLTFPELRSEDFAPWVDPGAAASHGVDRATYAGSEAATWQKGLGDWGQDGDRIRRLREAVTFRLFTPASDAGEPLNMVAAFTSPDPAVTEDKELLGHHAEHAARALLSLIGEPQPEGPDRRVVFLAALLSSAWSQGNTPDLPTLLGLIDTPPFVKLGLMDLEDYYPAAERRKLMMSFNHVLASPSFAAWMEGFPLSIDRLLYDPDGKPQISVVSVAHLPDHERMFAISLILQQLLVWVRRQRGTSALRAMLYFDELFGYLPPVAEPPSKRPLLTLLKQARAYGLGLVLSTQNPGDLDYKALGNLGTWFIGRLQADTDRKKLVEGLQSGRASADAGTWHRRLANLEPRQFIVQNVHDDATGYLETRWVMAYLKGPMTREDYRLLYDEGLLMRPEAITAETAEEVPVDPVSPEPAGTTTEPESAPPPAESADEDAGTAAMTADTGADKEAAEETDAGAAVRASKLIDALPKRIPALFDPDGQGTLYPHLLTQVHVTYEHRPSGQTTERAYTYMIPMEQAVVPLRWDALEASELPVDHWAMERPAGVTLAPLPAAAEESPSYTQWKKDVTDYVYREESLALMKDPVTGLTSYPGETERAYRIRVREALREQRDEAVEAATKAHGKELERLERKLQQAERALERESSQASEAKRQTAISFGGAILNLFLGKGSRGHVGRATTTARGASRSKRQSEDVRRQEEQVREAEAAIDALEASFEEELREIEAGFAPDEAALETESLRPLKKHIRVTVMAVVWR